MGDIEYSIRNNHKTKTLKITIHPDASVVLTKPKYVDLKTVYDFVALHVLQINEILEKIKSQPNFHFSGRQHYLKHKENARILVLKKVNYWNRFYGFSFNRISIKRLRSRWGSCSSKGNLNFNYHILFLPDNLVDYIVVHELCHLGQMNHSKKFWALVEKTLPDFVDRKENLKKLDFFKFTEK